MERKEISEKVGQILITILGHSDFEMQENLTADSVDGWDSLNHMIIVTEIEKEFKINFKLRELNKLNNISSLIDLIESKL